MIPTTDQWKRTGNCELCRKKSYCHNPCRANKNREKRMVRDAVEKAMAKVMPAYVGRIIDEGIRETIHYAKEKRK